MTSKLKTDVLETVSGSGTIALTNQLSGMTSASVPQLTTAHMPSGSVIQTVTSQLNVSHNNSTSTTYVPTGVTLSITPTSTSSKILVIMHVGMGISYTNAALQTSLARGSTLIGGSTYSNHHYAANTSTNVGVYHSYTLMHTDSPSTTSSTAYKLYFKSSTGNVVYATHSGSSVNITLQEIKG